MAIVAAPVVLVGAFLAGYSVLGGGGATTELVAAPEQSDVNGADTSRAPSSATPTVRTSTPGRRTTSREASRETTRVSPPASTTTTTRRTATTTTTTTAKRTTTSTPSTRTSTTAAGSAGGTTNSADEAEVLRLVNVQRAKAGCTAVSADSTLTKVAREHSKDMAANNYFSHDSKDGKDPFERMSAAGYAYSWAAENIAAGQATPAAVMTSWMNSAGHKANILNCKLTELGVGVWKQSGSAYGIYWTQDFGTPR